jgi:8-oxo-dGTP pyrophosphatase MutT (NUDIX family)
MNGAGIIFTTPDGMALFVKRTGGDHAGTWAWPGGGIEDGETSEEAARREALEETGYETQGDIEPVDSEENEQGSFETFHNRVDRPFVPELNNEHTSYAWAPLDDAPTPLHPGVASTIEALNSNLVGDGFEEGDHPRSKNGQFGSGGGGKSIKMSDAKKKSGKMGSNPGGVYEHDGKDYYIKEGKTKDHVSNELLAGSLYNLAGSKTLNYHPVEGGEHIATEMNKLDKKNVNDFTPEEKKKSQLDFATHAWLANWDAAGLGGDNQGIIDGNPVSLDLGGALKYRGQGAAKGDKFGDYAGEFSSLRDRKLNPDNAKLFSSMTPKALRESAAKVTSIADDDIRAAVKAHGYDDKMADKLIARKKSIADQASSLAKDEAFAFDRASVRRTDNDGRLHVEVTNISKANVCPYLGREIPDWYGLGLDADKVYHLYRDPEELAKAAPTFNNIPVLSEHVETNAGNHKHELVIGTTGTDAEFKAPFLRNSMSFWDGDAIEDVERELKKELSSAYRYRADMTPGTAPSGERFDGVMRDIVGNHVALVEEGRAGPDVVVGDSNKELNMKKKVVKVSQKAVMARGALASFIQPRLAADAKMPSLAAILLGVNAKNFGEKKSAIFAGVKKALEGKLAKDASAEGLKALLDSLEKTPVAEGMDPKDDVTLDAEEDPKDPGVVKVDKPDPMEAIMQLLEGKVPPELMEQIKALCAPEAGADEPPPFKGMPKADCMVGDEDDEDLMAGDKDKEMIDKPAMDAALKKQRAEIETAVAKTHKAIREAERAVRPYVGEISQAFDSAADVYRHTLKALKVDIEGVDSSAYPAMLKLVPVPGAAKTHVQNEASLGMDAAATADFVKRFPGASRIGHA